MSVASRLWTTPELFMPLVWLQPVSVISIKIKTSTDGMVGVPFFFLFGAVGFMVPPLIAWVGKWLR